MVLIFVVLVWETIGGESSHHIIFLIYVGQPHPSKKSGGARPLSHHAHSLVELVLAWLDGDWVPAAMARGWVVKALVWFWIIDET